jgi:hypothetical protein
LSFAELQWSAMEVREKSRRGLRPAGFSVDWLLCELTRRAELLWPWRGDRRGVMVAGLDVTTRCLVFVCQSNGGEGAAACCRRGTAPGVLPRRGGAVWRRGRRPAPGARRGWSRPLVRTREGEGGRGGLGLRKKIGGGKREGKRKRRKGKRKRRKEKGK